MWTYVARHEDPFGARLLVLNGEVEYGTSAILPRRQLETNRSDVRSNEMLLPGRLRFIALRPGSFDVARMAAADAIEGGYGELVAGAAHEILEHVRVHASVEQNLLPVPDLLAIGQHEASNGCTACVAHPPLQIYGVGSAGGNFEFRWGGWHQHKQLVDNEIGTEGILHVTRIISLVVSLHVAQIEAEVVLIGLQSSGLWISARILDAPIKRWFRVSHRNTLQLHIDSPRDAQRLSKGNDGRRN